MKRQENSEPITPITDNMMYLNIPPEQLIFQGNRFSSELSFRQYLEHRISNPDLVDILRDNREKSAAGDCEGIVLNLAHPISPEVLKSIELIVTATGFETQNIEQNGHSSVIIRPRPYIQEVFGPGGIFLLKEAASRNETESYLAFQKERYAQWNPPLEFDIRIENMFTPHSDAFIVYRNNGPDEGKIVGVGRYCHLTPTRPLPLMLARDIKGNPASVDVLIKNCFSTNRIANSKIGETLAVYSTDLNPRERLVVYTNLIKKMFRYMASIGVDFMFTTNEVNDQATHQLYIEKFGLRYTGADLIYGDFSKEWTACWQVLCFDKASIIKGAEKDPFKRKN